MVYRGANPYVVAHNGRTWANETCHLSNLPTQKSVFFTTRPLPDVFRHQNEFEDPWLYRSGVFKGKFKSVIDQGASGIVLKGEWFGMKAAFKFVEIGVQKVSNSVEEGLKTLDQKLSEMISLQSTSGSKIVSFYGHYR